MSHPALILESNRSNPIQEKKDVWQGTLALMVLKTLDVLGPRHGYGIARRIEQGRVTPTHQRPFYPLHRAKMALIYEQGD
jgi:hypothetical protein